MREKTIKLYTYDELSEEAQAKARDWYREISAGDFDAESVLEDAASLGAMFGFDLRRRRVKCADGTIRLDVSIYYSLSCGQSDGVTFDATWRASGVKHGKVAIEAPLDEELQRIAAEFERIAKLYPEGRFSVGPSRSSNTFDFDISPPEHTDDVERTAQDGTQILKRMQATQVELKEATDDFAYWIYKQVRDAYEWESADEQVAENIRANEYEFTIDGKREA